MGLDLTLLPFECDTGNFAYSHSVLNCFRRHELFEAMFDAKIEIDRVPSDFNSYMGRVPDGTNQGERGYGKTNETPYGDPLMWTRVSDLLKFANHSGVQDNPMNRAVWAYLKELPPDTKIALYWH